MDLAVDDVVGLVVDEAVFWSLTALSFLWSSSSELTSTSLSHVDASAVAMVSHFETCINESVFL